MYIYFYITYLQFIYNLNTFYSIFSVIIYLHIFTIILKLYIRDLEKKKNTFTDITC